MDQRKRIIQYAYPSELVIYKSISHRVKIFGSSFKAIEDVYEEI